MSELLGRIRGARNPLERLAAHLPGLRSYHDRESRREADHLIRTFGASRLDRIIEFLHEATRKTELGRMAILQDLVNRAERLRNELRHADRGYAGFFDEMKWDDPRMLESVHEHTAALIDRVVELERQTSEGEIEHEELFAAISELERTLEDRRHAILDLVAR